ncbi:aryl-alcohol dehydrogenase-like predicted oxidoreductase [Nocardioides thalensis]|uniref:Aryl-alcohol dehydrogenase-like predicted oxidoreductase n=1 Tax=Nocardioides thalensis TaxID=1914755 RepID=A0A853C185_9ACTN|nr:aldo/keto reductase [Nocardioides thalensis]NYJ01355.1 aryl-alcohol dehydrogenase-like predicted oxidoreductase [Nocardioides thalensis]
MQERNLGRTGLRVSRTGLGTMTWGTATDEHEARDQLIAFVEAGGNLVDTANVYGAGASEELLGSLVGDVVPREELVIATKAGFGLRRGQRVYDTSRGYLLSTLDLSLRRLGVDHVDLWQMHVWDDGTPLDETLAALDTAVSSGRAAYVGISNYTGWQTAQAATWQQAVPGRAQLASTQMEYSLVNRAIEAEVLPAAAACGLGVLPYSPLGKGVLTGKYRGGIPSDSRGASEHAGKIEAYLDEGSRGIVESVVRAADGLGWTPLEVALVWVRDRPGVTAPIVGSRTTVQLKAALGAEDKELPPEIRAALDDVSESAA